MNDNDRVPARAFAQINRNRQRNCILEMGRVLLSISAANYNDLTDISVRSSLEAAY